MQAVVLPGEPGEGQPTDLGVGVPFEAPTWRQTGPTESQVVLSFLPEDLMGLWGVVEFVSWLGGCEGEAAACVSCPPQGPPRAAPLTSRPEEKDAELDRRIIALRKKNQALLRRYQVSKPQGLMPQGCLPCRL